MIKLFKFFTLGRPNGYKPNDYDSGTLRPEKTGLLDHSRLARFNPLSRRFAPCLLCKQPQISAPPHSNARNTPARASLCDYCAELICLQQAYCPGCGERFAPTETQARLCGHCLAKPPSQTQTVIGHAYQYPLDYMITQLKFNGQFQYIEALCAGLLTEVRKRYALTGLPGALVPVPLHAERLRARGFNQAQLIAARLSHKLQLPLLALPFSRIKPTQAQSQLKASARRRNLQNAFQCAVGLSELSRYPHVALVDDVITTGATMNAAAQTLLKAGATRVDAWCIARA